MELCEFCSRLKFDELPKLSDPPLLFHENYGVLRSRAKFCKLCLIVKCILKRQQGKAIKEGGRLMRSHNTASSFLFLGGPILDEPHKDERIEVRGNWIKLRDENDAPPVLVGLFATSDGVGKYTSDEAGEINESRWPGQFHADNDRSLIRLCTEMDGVLADVIPGRLLEGDSGSMRAMQKASLWALDCNMHHNCVDVIQKRCLPTRVIEIFLVGNDERDVAIRLRETAGEAENYIALSHCWGKSWRLITTRANLKRHKKSIHLASLPQTFRDAIYLARKLKITFVWIDSLCIVQDDVSDWEREALRMGEVYAGAYLTISALAASDDKQGIFWGDDRVKPGNSRPEPFVPPWIDRVKPGKSRPKPFVHPWIVQEWEGASAPFCLVNTSKNKLAKVWFSDRYSPGWAGCFHSKKMEHETKTKLDDESLTRRGWAFQERLLSQRLLHFGTNQMYWECQQKLLYEDGTSFESPKTDLSTVMAQHAKGIAGDWQRLVEKYAVREFTFEDDKLPAIAGLARRIAEATGDVYLAGLWRSQLLSNLAWKKPMSLSKYLSEDHKHQRLSVLKRDRYRAPSWSWAAIDAEIQYSAWSAATNSVATLLDYHIQTHTGDPFGRIQSASITIRAPFHKVEPTRVSNSTVPGRKVEVEDEQQCVLSGMAVGDVDENFTTCYVLFLTAAFALVLMPSTKEKEDVNRGKVEGEQSWAKSRSHQAEQDEPEFEQERPVSYVRVGWARFPADNKNAVMFLARPEHMQDVVLV